MRIALATDHAGFEALKQLKEFLTQKGHKCVDYGPKFFDPDDDYPDFIFPAAKAVASHEVTVAIIMGSSGQGEAMVANRVKGVRAAVFYGSAKAPAEVDADGKMPEDDYEILRLSRQHNLANVLSLAARFLDQEEIEKAVTIWLETPLGDVKRHLRRVKKIEEAE